MTSRCAGIYYVTSFPHKVADETAGKKKKKQEVIEQN